MSDLEIIDKYDLALIQLLDYIHFLPDSEFVHRTELLKLVSVFREIQELFHRISNRLIDKEFSVGC